MIDKYIYRKIQSKQHLVLSVPAKLDALLLENEMIEFNGKLLKSDYIKHLADSLITRYYFSNKEKNSRIKFNVSSEVCRVWYGTFYNFYIAYLVSIGFITLYSKHHMQTGKCTTYKLNLDFLTKVPHQKISNHYLLSKWKTNTLLQKGTDKGKHIDKKLKRQLVEDLFYVNVETDSAIMYLDSMMEQNFISDLAYQRNIISVKKISDGSLYFKEDKFGRLHTNFTTLKKVVRDRHLKIDGETTAEHDIKCSQPFFFSHYLRTECQHFDMVKPDEYARFAATVETGMIYDLLANHGNISRGEAKTLTYRVLFGHTNMDAPAFVLFHSLFPSINRAIAAIKVSSGDHKVLAHELQRIESNIIFNCICKRIKKECRGVRLFTVHDSIFCQKRFESKVRVIFDEELNKLKITI